MAEFVSHYEVLSELGSGGMGRVYKVMDQNLEKVFALKIVDKITVTDHVKVRFQKEAKALSILSHPAIPEVYNFGISEDRPYMVMDYVEGRSLKQLLEEERILPVHRVVELAVQICDALAYSHSNGIFHRDLKPENLILDDDGLLRVIDFGLAKLESDDSEEQDMTKTGVVVGSPPYMSPEQIQGNQLDGRSDIYSLGCVLFELLTGEKPFKGKNALATISMHVSSPVPRLSDSNRSVDYSEALENVISRCLRKMPEERYLSMSEMKDALMQLEGSEARLDEKLEDEENPVDDSRARSPLSRSLIISGLFALSFCLLWVFFDTLFDNVDETKEIVYGTNKKADKSPYGYGPIDQERKVRDEKAYMDLLKESHSRVFQVGSSKSEFFNGTLLQGSSGVTDGDLRVLQADPLYRWKMKEYRTISLCSKDLRGQGLSNLNNTLIERLDLTSSGIQDDALKHLAGIKRLRVLSLSDTSISDRGLSTLVADARKLEILDLSNCKSITVNGLKKLEKLPRLKTLKITGIKSDGRLARVVQSCKTLERLIVDSKQKAILKGRKMADGLKVEVAS